MTVEDTDDWPIGSIRWVRANEKDIGILIECKTGTFKLQQKVKGDYQNYWEDIHCTYGLA